MASKKKVMVIGLDGASWEVITRLLEEECMPYLNTLVKGGVKGNLKSTIPPLSAPAWTSFQTGVNPGSHGIYDFVEFDQHNLTNSLVDAQAIKAPTLWDITSKAEKKSIIINIPLTYPPTEDPNRITIGGMLSPSVEPSFVYPQDIYAKVKKHDYQIMGPALSERKNKTLEQFIKEEISVEERRALLAKELLQKYEWDIFAINLYSVDRVQHAYYKYLFPHFKNFRSDKYNSIKKFYKRMDTIIEKLAHESGSNTFILILSDHGFRRISRYIMLNQWLIKKKLLHVNWSTKLLNQLLKSKIVLKAIRKSYNFVNRSKSPYDKRLQSANLNQKSTKWEPSKAIMLNRTGFGSVFLLCDIEDKQKITQAITDKLSRLRDPSTGEEVVKKSYVTDQWFSGPYIEQLPDIFIEPNDPYTFSSRVNGASNTFMNLNPYYDHTGDHSRDGIIIFNGPGIKQEENIDAKMIDIAPTILALMGLKIPVFMEGTVLNKILEEPVKVEFDESITEDFASRVKSPTKSDKDEVRKRLEDLGYL